MRLDRRGTDDPALLAHHYESANAWERGPELPAPGCGESREPRGSLGGGRALPARHPRSRTPSRHGGVPANLPRDVPGAGSGAVGSTRPKQERAEALHQVDRAIAFADGDIAALAGLQSFKGVDWLEEPLLVSAERHAGFADAALQAEVAWRYANFLGNTGRLEESLGKIERAAELLQEVGALEELGSLRRRCGPLLQCPRRAVAAVSAIRGDGPRDCSVDPGRRGALVAGDGSRAFALQGALAARRCEVVEQNLSTAWENGRWSVVLWASGWAAIACLKLNRISDARAFLDPVMKTVARRIDNDFCKIYPHIALSQLHLAEGDAAAGLHAAERALELAERVTARLEIGAAHRALGQAYEARGDRQSADGQFRRSVDVLQTIQSRPELAQSLLAFGRFELADGQR